jgi:hypothetical protein
MAGVESLARLLPQVWRYEAAGGLTDAEAYGRMKLAREVHAGNPEVWPEVEELLREEADYVRGRAEEWVAQFEPGERGRWRRLLNGEPG